jgi:Putative restriction endonuclease
VADIFWLVEVSDSTLAYDCGEKALAYARAGIQDYWVLIRRQRLHLFRQPGEQGYGDRIDAIGAIGIARAFAYSGFKGQEIYNPEVVPKLHNSFDEYKSSKTTTINHFYEKLMLLEDLMNTNTGKEIAKSRSLYMKEYLDKFLLEWQGNDYENLAVNF